MGGAPDNPHDVSRQIPTGPILPASMPSSQQTETASISAERDDLPIVLAALTGSSEALDRLFEKLECLPRILAAINRKFGSPLQAADLADLTQETLTKIWTKLDRFRQQGPIDAWAYRFCFLEFMNRLRQQNRRSKLQSESIEHHDPAAGGPDPIALEIEEIESQLEILGPPESEVIRLKHFDGLTFPEIGKFLEVSPNTAKTYYYRGIDWLRRRLAPERPERER
ncbi:MAG: sigma-70 family RNA polymerase sigma factor [Planctomycetota bacterium]